MIHKRLILMTFFLLIILFCTITNVNADANLSEEIKEPNYGSHGVHHHITYPADRVWVIAREILRVASFTVFIVIGIKYMFASAEQKGALKGALGMSVIGIILVFGVNLVIKFVQTLTLEVLE